MSIMSSVQKPKDRAPVVTICGDAGTGKTSLAALWPSPVFIRAEDGMQSIPADKRPDAFPLLSGKTAVEKCEQLTDQLRALYSEKHEYKTVVIDSVTAIDRLFEAAILEGDVRAKSINQALGGYGAGARAVASKHYELRKQCGSLNEDKGLAIVFIGHASTETLRLPDQDDYQRWTLRMSEKSLPPYVDDVDVVAFLRLETIIKGDTDEERARAVSTGARLLICHSAAANVSKNRYEIEKPLECPKGINPLAEYIPFLKG